MLLQPLVRARLVFHLLGLAFLLMISNLVLAQANPAAHDVFIYQGQDREQFLIEGAKKEGGLSLYTSMTNKDMAQIVKAFESKYGIKVTFWRGSAQKVLQRTVTEASAGRHDVDVIHAHSLVMEALYQEKLLHSAVSPYMKDLVAKALHPHDAWTALRADVYVQAYNTDKVSKAELPKTFEDLLDPRWKGRLGVEAKAQEWFRMVLQEMGVKKGTELFRKLVAANGVSVRSGNSLMNNLVVSGEVPLTLSVYNYMPETSRENGAPIDYVALKPTIAYTDGIGVARHVKHPYTAMLFYDFMLRDGLLILKNQQHLTMSKRDQSELESRFHPIFIDVPKMLVDYDKWTEFYQDTIAGRAPSWVPPELEANK